MSLVWYENDQSWKTRAITENSLNSESVIQIELGEKLNNLVELDKIVADVGSPLTSGCGEIYFRLTD